MTDGDHVPLINVETNFGSPNKSRRRRDPKAFKRRTAANTIESGAAVAAMANKRNWIITTKPNFF